MSRTGRHVLRITSTSSLGTHPEASSSTGHTGTMSVVVGLKQMPVRLRLLDLTLLVVWNWTALSLTQNVRLPSAEHTTFFGKLLNRLGGQRRGAVVNSVDMMSLVDGDGGMHDLGGDDLLVDDRLDVLVHVVVDALADYSRSNGLGARGLVDG